MRYIGILFTLFWAGAALADEGWEARIADARATAERIAAWGATHGRDYNHIGTFTRQADIAVLRCSILAELTGIGDISDHVEYYGPDPALPRALPDRAATPGDDAVLEHLGYAWNLRSWAHLAEQVLGSSADQLAETWELQCNGQHGIPEGLVVAAWDTRATFRLDGRRLYVLGDIEPGFYEEFAEVVAANEIGFVMLGSRGGSVEDAMQAGGLIRRLGLATELYGDCESACPLLYFSGAEPRIQRLPLYRLGFHRISAGGAAIPLDHEIYEIVAAFIDAMGVNSDYILTAMRDTPPENMYYPPYQWLCDANAGWFYGNCTQPHP